MSSVLERVIEYLPWNRIPTSNRTIHVGHHKPNADKTFCDNSITTTKYNVFNFIPKNLFEQFFRLANLYFLFMACLQLFSGLSPTDRWGTPIALLIVVIFQMLKDAYEDIGRFISDRAINNQTTTVIEANSHKQVKWSEVRVGDVLSIQRDEYVPADLAILSTSHANQTCYVETLQLDGETNLKIREAIPCDLLKTPKCESTIDCEAPNKMLYEFVGRITVTDTQNDTKEEVPMKIENILLRGSKLRNTDAITGAVIYTGKHSRIVMNSRKLPHKSSKLESITNKFIIILFVLQTCINLACAIALLFWNRNNQAMWYIMRGWNQSEAVVFIEGFLSLFMLYGQFVPLALYVTLEIVRLLQTRLFMEQDLDMYDPECDSALVAKSTSLTDDLGQIEHIFSDKTGTLTQNKMTLLQVATREGRVYEDISQCNVLACHQLFQMLALCHTVIPEQRKNGIEYQASSLDELALVLGAKQNGFELLERAPHAMKLVHKDQIEEYEILNVLEFSYERKRMSIIVRTPDQKIKLYCKGADSVMLPLMRTPSHKVEDVLKAFGDLGLRTLVCAELELDEETYNEWNTHYFIPASLSILDKNDKMLEAMALIETNLEYIGSTAIEDKLQDQVPETIQILTDAGIKVWVLTGDKQETAIVIGYACNILDDSTTILDLNAKSRQQLARLIQNGIENPRKKAVVIDGDSLKILFESQDKIVRVKFLSLCLASSSVICCRVSPDQKALIVNLVREYQPQSVTLAIGDGANDVSMIRTAHVGIGIMGKEGRQASNASDYAIGQFRFLRKLLLVHGRWNYRRVSKLILYSIYKSIALNCVQLWYFIFNGASGTSIFEPFLLSLFYTIFTGLPIGFFGLLDQDVSAKNTHEFPLIYTHGHQNYHLNARVFLGWTANSFYHSAMCFFIPYLVYDMGTSFHHNGQPADMDGVGLAALSSVVLVVTFKLVLETRTFTVINHLTYWASSGSFFVVAIVYSAIPGRFYFGCMNNMATVQYWFAVMLTVTLALLRDLLWKGIVRNTPLSRQLYHELQDHDQYNKIAHKHVSKEYELSLKSPMRKVIDRGDDNLLWKALLFWSWFKHKAVEAELIPSEDTFSDVSDQIESEPTTPVTPLSSTPFTPFTPATPTAGF